MLHGFVSIKVLWLDPALAHETHLVGAMRGLRMITLTERHGRKQFEQVGVNGEASLSLCSQYPAQTA